MNSLQRKIAANLIFLGGGQGLSWLFTAVYLLVIPRYLGPAGIGTLGLMLAVMALVAVAANFGMRVFLTREIARNPAVAEKLVGPAVIMSVGIATLSWLVIFAIFAVQAQLAALGPVLCVSAALSIINCAISPIQAALQGMDRMHYSFGDAFLRKGAGTALAVAFVALNLGLVWIAATDLIVALPVAAMYIWAFYRLARLHLTPNMAVFRHLLRSGLAFFVVDITFTVYLYLDAIMLATLTTTTVVGYYNVPTRLFGTLMVVPTVLSQAILPSLARLATQDDGSAMHGMSRKTLLFLVCASLPFAAGTTVMAEPAISFFYGPAFTQSVPIMVILSWTVVPTCLGIGLYNILVARNKQTQWTKTMLLASAINVCANLILIPIFQQQTGNGGIGAALSLLLTECIIGVFGVVMVGRTIVDRNLIVAALKSLVAAVVMAAAVWPLRDLFLPLPLCVGVAVYCLAIILFGLVPLKTLRSLITTVLQIVQHKRREQPATLETDVEPSLPVSN